MRFSEVKLPISGRLAAAAPQGSTEPDRGTGIGFAALGPRLFPLVACDDLSPRGSEARFMRRGSREAQWSN